MRMIFGIDPGLNGAIANISFHINNTIDVNVRDLPTKPLGVKGKKRQIDCDELAHMVRWPASSDSYVCLEDVHAMPCQGVTSMFSLGHSLGCIKGVLASLWGGDRVRLVQPQAWKKYYGLTNNKEESRLLAIELFPEMKDKLKRKKDSDRAEALLIAKYGIENYD